MNLKWFPLYCIWYFNMADAGWGITPISFIYWKKVSFFIWILFKVSFFKKKDFTYLFLEREEGRKKERERNTSVWLLFTCPQLGTWSATQACALTWNRTGDTLVCRPMLNPLTYTSQGYFGINLMKEVKDLH